MLRVLPIFWTCPFPVKAGLLAVVFVGSRDFQVFRGEYEKILWIIGTSPCTSLWWYTLKHHLSGQEDCFVFTVLFPTHFDLHLAFIRENVHLHYWKWLCIYHKGKGNSIPLTGLERPRGFQEADATRCQDNWHMKVGRLSALRTGPPSKERFLVLMSVRGWVNPRTIVRPEDYVNEKFQWHHRETNPRPSGFPYLYD
jgi:hypothetical protein